MRFQRLILTLICGAFLCTSCNDNSPSEETGNKLIKGVWRVESGTRTSNTGTNPETGQIDVTSLLSFPLVREWYFGEFLGREMVEFDPYSLTNDVRWRDYELSVTDNGYQLIIFGIHDTEENNQDNPSLQNVAVSIRVMELKSNRMEWELKVGAEKEYTYRLQLKKIARKI